MSEIRIVGNSYNLFARETLNELFRMLPDASAVNILAKFFEGRVLSCAEPEVFHQAGVNKVRVASVTAALGGRFIEAENLEVVVQPYQQRSIFLRLQPTEKPLNPEDPALVWLDPCPRLALSDQEGPAIELVRLCWPAGLAVVDQAYWPPTVAIANDARSLRAARRLAELFPSPPLHLQMLFDRVARLSWDQLLPEIVRELWQRSREDSARAAALGVAVSSAEDGEIVGRLLAILEGASEMPPEVSDQGRKFELQCILQPTQSDLHDTAGSLRTQHCVFPALAASGWFLALIVRANHDGEPCEVVVCPDQKNRPSHLLKRVIFAGREARIYGELTPGQPASVDVTGGVVTVAGAYSPRP